MDQIQELERRIRTLENNLLVTNRVIQMLTFQAALESGAASYIIKAADMLEGMSHTGLKEPDDQELFLEYENRMASSLRSLGEALEIVLREKRHIEQKLNDKALRKKIEEVLDSTHFEVLPVRTVIEK